MKTTNLKLYWFIISGILFTLLWLTLFVAGLLIDSSYYRAALNYGFAKPVDWMWTILTFTLSNVALLAFLAGLLGGICSKVSITESFTLTEEKLKESNHSSILFENPFISAFRGVFVFVGILSIQYLSSFSDLGTIGSSSAQEKTAKEQSDQLYVKLLETLDDSTSKAIIKDLQLKEEKRLQESSPDSLISEIFCYTDSISCLSDNSSGADLIRIRNWEEKIKSIRRNLKVPSIADIPGMTSYSYFKFAIIVSLLAFIFGYDPRRFTDFLSKLPIPGKNSENKKDSDKEGNKKTEN
jgi:hypothetical protein